jgi:hypothetical protein
VGARPSNSAQKDFIDQSNNAAIDATSAAAARAKADANVEQSSKEVAAAGSELEAAKKVGPDR